MHAVRKRSPSSVMGRISSGFHGKSSNAETVCRLHDDNCCHSVCDSERGRRVRSRKRNPWNSVIRHSKKHFQHPGFEPVQSHPSPPSGYAHLVCQCPDPAAGWLRGGIRPIPSGTAWMVHHIYRFDRNRSAPVLCPTVCLFLPRPQDHEFSCRITGIFCPS